MEALPPSRGSACSGGGAVGEGFLGRDGAVGAYHAGGDAEGFLAVDVGGEEVDDAED